MKKIIILFSLIFLFFGYGNSVLVLAEEVVDTTPPTGTISINNGDLYTNSRDVILNLSAEDISGVSEMKIANYTSYHEWEAYTETKPWTLSPLDGEKIVRVKFKDSLGNETATGIPAKIILDTVTPTLSLVGESNINLNVGDVYVDQGVVASDDLSGDLTSDVSIGGTFVDTLNEGNYTITYDVKDLAGNQAVQVVRTINILKDEEVIIPKLVSLSITNPANKLNYKIGETLDIGGLEVTGTYSDNSTKTEMVTINDVTGFDSSTSFNNQTLTITINGKLTTYFVNILNNDSSGGNDINSNILINDDVQVTNSCEILDTDGLTHIFTDKDSSSGFLAICALKKALDDGIINQLSFKNDSSFGLYIESINNIKPNDIEYWSVWQNDEYANCGVGCLNISDGDILSFVLTNWMTETEISKIIFKIKTIDSSSTNNQNGGSAGSNSTSKEFSVDKAFQFLISKQENDGSYSNEMYTDWVAVALSLGKVELKEKIKEYLISNDINSNLVTDNERRALALMSLGVNPYSGTKTDYIKKIIDNFDGVQLGDPLLINDDVFGLIVLQNAGYDEKDEIINKIILNILNNQSKDGSWGSVDLTAGVIMSLQNFDSISGVLDSISLAKDYLIESQDNDGGFENIFATSWAIQALASDDLYNDEIKDSIYYLAINQDDDGGLTGENMDSRIWSTAYAIPAFYQLSWNDIIHDFSRPIGDQEVLVLNNNILEKNTIKDIKTEEPKIIQEKLNEIKESEILASTETEENLLENDVNGIDKSDLLASSVLSTNGNLVSSKTLILFLGTVLVLIFINFVLRRKF